MVGQGYDGGYERVKVASRGLRGDPIVEATARFETGPGEQAQADWLETKLHVEHNGQMHRLDGFIYVLGYSRWSYLEFTVSESQQVLFNCFEHAFREAGGVPAAILVDNMNSAVLHHRADEIVFHPAFLAFAEHWGFEPIAAKPGRAQTKGKSEAGVKYAKRNCLAGQRPPTLEAVERHRHWRLGVVCNVRVHETTHRRPVDLIQEERGHLARWLEVSSSTDRSSVAGSIWTSPSAGRTTSMRSPTSTPAAVCSARRSATSSRSCWPGGSLPVTRSSRASVAPPNCPSTSRASTGPATPATCPTSGRRS